MKFNFNHIFLRRTDFLEPEDPYFVKIGKVFVEEVIIILVDIFK